MSALTTVIIPFRSLTEGKSRLSSVLSGEERQRLNGEMLERVVKAAAAVSSGPEVVVVSPDSDGLELAQRAVPEIIAVWQPPTIEGLNGALELATGIAIEDGARTIAIVPADLPLVSSSDIDNLLRRDAPVVIAPDRRRSGTNGLMQRIDATKGKFRYLFGIDSYHKHLKESHRLGLDSATAISLGTSFDLDTPADLADFSPFAYGAPALTGSGVLGE